MATISNNLGAKMSENEERIFVCKICDYKCCKKFNYDRHLVSSKHIKATYVNNLATQNEQNEQIRTKYFCEKCGKEYNDRTGLWRHNKKCISNTETISQNNKLSDLDKDELIITLLKQNAELIKGQQDMMMKVVENGITNTNHNHSHNNNNNTNSHNKAFNLNFFLNETCKNAMNITDFVDSIKLQLNDLMDVGELGYVEGISKIIVKNLNNLDETIRPIHCTDKKRETMYIKDEGQWAKEDEERKKIRKVIKTVANKNIKMLPKFREKYPDYENASNKISDTYEKMVIESMTSDENKDEKIIKNISKVTTITQEK